MNLLREHPALDLGGAWQFAFTMEPSAVQEFTKLAAVRAAGLPVYPCTVPGNFELDLLANGLCEEPSYGNNIRDLAQYEHAHIWYAGAFEAEDQPGKDTLLTFEGLDCYQRRAES